MNKQIITCPFCFNPGTKSGDNVVGVIVLCWEQRTGTGEKRYYYECKDCGARGPTAKTKGLALTKWNTRYGVRHSQRRL